MVALAETADAWSEFWREQRPDSHCLANACFDIRQALEGHWGSFSSRLLPGARVLDIGCGAGAAGHALVRAQPQVEVVGVDVADIAPSTNVRVKILPRTAMERLPFAAESFDAAVSQFGFEYGQVEQTSRELARVLRPGAPFSFLVHHSEGRISTDSELHRRALEALCAGELEAAFLSGNSAILVRQLSQIRQHCPHERIVDQAAHGLMRHITAPPVQRMQIWRAVKAALAPELVLLAALEVSRVSPADINSWLRPLAERFEMKPPAVIPMPGGKPLCWRIEGFRRA